VDGRTLPAPDTARWTRRFDPSLAATWEELGLSAVNYENCARTGHFGRDLPWECAPAGTWKTEKTSQPTRVRAAAS
jgi:S-adenosylmethionine synthetase